MLFLYRSVECVRVYKTLLWPWQKAMTSANDCTVVDVNSIVVFVVVVVVVVGRLRTNKQTDGWTGPWMTFVHFFYELNAFGTIGISLWVTECFSKVNATRFIQVISFPFSFRFVSFRFLHFRFSFYLLLFAPLLFLFREFNLFMDVFKRTFYEIK